MVDTASMTKLLAYILSLSPENQRWLVDNIKIENDSGLSDYEEDMLSENIEPYTLDELKARIRRADKDFKEGNVYDHAEVMAEAEMMIKEFKQKKSFYESSMVN